MTRRYMVCWGPLTRSDLSEMGRSSNGADMVLNILSAFPAAA